MLILRLGLEQLVLNDSHQTGTCEVELEGEIRSVHFNSLAVRFVVDVLISATKGSGIARCDEEVEILGCRRGEIDESRTAMSFMEGLAYDENYTHLGFFLP